MQRRLLSLCGAFGFVWFGIACDPYPQDESYLGSAGAAAGGAATGGAATGGAGGSCPRQELLVNGDFDAGGDAWFESSDIWPNLILDPAMAGVSVAPHSGTLLARLGGHGSKAGDGLMATVDVPPSAQDIVFSYYTIVTTTDTSAEAHDSLLIVLDSDSKYGENIIDNTKAHSTWQRFEAKLDPSAAGKYLVLLVTADSNDDMLATTFLVDSFSLSATICP